MRNPPGSGISVLWVARAAGVPEDEKKERAVRKVVRLLIENNEGNGEQIKKKIDAKYRWGAVWWQGEDDKWQKVAQWNTSDERMTLMGVLGELGDSFNKLMQ